jgi:hypothetical protein
MGWLSKILENDIAHLGLRKRAQPMALYVYLGDRISLMWA